MKRIALLLALSTLAARGQSTISPADKFGYGANFGWINFRPSSADGVVVRETCLAGQAWSGNFGWINLGDGTPANGHTYSNSSATDYGVNLSASGRLTGSAWAPNVGWITFEQTHGQPRVDLLTGEFTGHAWSANAGWLHLDTSQSDLRTASVLIADTDNDGLGDAWEFLHFQNLTAAGATTNADHDPAGDLDEYRAGTAPNDPSDWLQLTSQSLAPSGTSVTLRFTTALGRLYRIEFNDNLQGAWTNSNLGTFAPDAGAVTEKTLTIPAGPRRFFKVVCVRPLT